MNKEELLKLNKKELKEEFKKLVESTSNKNINCLGCSDLINCSDCSDSSNCSDSSDLINSFDCFNCSDLFYCSDCSHCSNLFNKKYCVLNVQLTKEEYNNFINNLK